MNTILIKLFATALTLSQVTTRPDAVRTQFDAATDGPKVVQLLRDGCAHMRKAFDIEDINLDELISTAMEDPSAVAGASAPKILHGLDIGELNTSYRQFCKGENPANSPFDARAVIEFYNKATENLPTAEALRDKALPGMTQILDGAGKPFAETFEANGRRLAVPIETVPTLVQKAFIAAEDKRFESHRGIDERGVIRAFIGNLAAPGRPPPRVGPVCGVARAWHMRNSRVLMRFVADARAAACRAAMARDAPRFAWGCAGPPRPAPRAHAA